MKRFGSLLLIMIVIGQPRAWSQRGEVEQSKFSVEEIPGEPRVEHPITAPDTVMKVLQTDKGVKSCLEDNPLESGQSLRSWFVASAVHLDGADEADLLVVPSFRGQESMCFQTPAGIGLFWIFRRSEEQYRLVLRTWAGGLQILSEKTNGCRDIQTGSLGQAGRDPTTVTFHFDGIKYESAQEKH